MAGSVNKLPIQRIDSSIKLSEITHGDAGWKKNVDLLVMSHTRDLVESSPATQQAKSDSTINFVTGGQCGNAKELIDNSNNNPDDLSLLYKKEGVAQSLALAILSKAFDDKNDTLVDALCSGDVAQVEKILPKGMEPMAQNVAEVMLPNEIVDQVTKLNRTLVNTPNSNERNVRTIDDVITNINQMIGNSPLPDGDIHITIAQSVVEKLQRRVEEIVKSNKVKTKESENSDRFVIPVEVEKQYDLARSLLDEIEFRGMDPWEISAGRLKDALDALRMSNIVDAEVKQEIESRMRLQQTMGYMSGADGWLDLKTPKPIQNQLLGVKGSAGLFKYEDLRFYLGLENGLSVGMARAWNLFEKINIGASEKGIANAGGYHDILVDIAANPAFLAKHGIDTATMTEWVKGGTGLPSPVDKEKMWNDAFSNYFMDGNEPRKALVRAYMAEQIMNLNKGNIGPENRDMTMYEAVKGVELAWNFMVASGEVSNFNIGFAGHRDDTELFHTKLDTLDRMSKGKPIGALTCLQRITSIAPPWLRYMSDRTIFGRLNAEDIKIDRMKGDIGSKYSIDYWYGAIVTQKLFELKSVMRAEGTTPKDLANQPALKKIGEWVAKAAKYPGVILDSNGRPIVDTANGDKLDAKGRPIVVTEAAKTKRERRIRFLLVAGWAEMIVSNIDLGWNPSEWKSFKDVLTRPFALNEDGKIGTFITKDEMEYIDVNIIGRKLGMYPNLMQLENIRSSRKRGTWIPSKIEQKSYNV